MTDDLDPLRAALSAAPAPDPAARAANIALAMENFDRAQAAGTGPRPSQDRPNGAVFLTKVKAMLLPLTARPALAVTTSIAALVVGVALILPVTEGLTPPRATPGTTADTVPDAPPDAPVSSVAQAEEPALKVAPEPEPAPLAQTEAAPADAGLASIESGGEAVVGAAAPEARRSLAESDLAFAPAPAAMAEASLPPPPLTEEFANADPNPVKVTAEEPVSTFSTDVDTASYALARSSLNAGFLPDPASIRVEEMVNYFPYAYPAPEPGQPFATTVSVMPTPWNPGTRLVTIGLQGALPAIEDRPALDLVFLIDTSGSMDDPAKLGLLKQSLALALLDLRPQDRVAIVAYAGSAGLVLPPTPASDSGAILGALDALAAGGATAGAEGLELAYQTAAGMAGDGRVSRVILATDGDFNLGISDPEGLTAYVARKRDEGTYLSVLGFGRGNLDDATMQALAQNGNGQAAYIDTLSEARKVLVDQLTGALFSIADDVKVQVEWNPAQIAEYRLIGYETRALDRQDFNNDAVDAGEIGAGLQVTAIYEVTAPGSPALLSDPLRYGEAAAGAGGSAELGFLRLRWKAPGEETSQLLETPITGAEGATAETRFAAAIAGMGQLLRGSDHLGGWGWDQAIALATGARGDDPFGYRAEAVTLMRLAQSLSR